MKLKWQQAPVKTQWGDDMVVASVAIDNDHTLSLYCERDQTPKVEAMFTSPPAQPVQDNPLDCGVYLGSGKRHEIKHHVSYGPEPIDTLIAAWQALEETSGHVLDEGDVEGRMHMSVIRSAWEQMDSLVRDLWDERGCI